MATFQQNNPLHGVKLADILTFLIDEYGYDKLAKRININCFKKDPSYKQNYPQPPRRLL